MLNSFPVCLLSSALMNRECVHMSLVAKPVTSYFYVHKLFLRSRVDSK